MLNTDEHVNKLNSLTIASAGDKPYIDQYDHDFIKKLYKDTGIDDTDDVPGEVIQPKLPGLDWENVKGNNNMKIAQLHSANHAGNEEYWGRVRNHPNYSKPISGDKVLENARKLRNLLIKGVK